MFFCSHCKLTFEDVDLYCNHLKEECHRNNLDVESYSDDVLTNFYCSICKIKCSGSVPYEEHLNSKNHKKKVKELELSKQYSQITSSEMSIESSITDASVSNNYASYEFKIEERNDDINSNDSIDFPFSCAACNRRFSGIVPYKQHLSSKKHEKKKKESELIKQIQMNKSVTEDTVIVSENEILSEFNKFSVVDDSVESRSCTICNVNFTGIESYKSHMIGKKHEKKIKELKAFERLQLIENGECDLNISISNEAIAKNILEACNEEVTDAVGFNSEQNSDANLCSSIKYDNIVCDEQSIENEKYVGKDLENIGEKFCKNEMNILAESAIDNERVQIDINKSNSKLTNFLENIPDNIQNHSFQCDVCGISFTGIIPYNQHLKGSKHKKEKMKAELIKLQSLNIDDDNENILSEDQKKEGELQISNTSLKTNQSNISLSSVNSAAAAAAYITNIDSCKNNSLFCKICNVACSGIIPYKQHIDSEKHLKKQLIYQKLNSYGDGSRDLKLQDLNITPSRFEYISEEKNVEMNVFRSECSDDNRAQLEKSEDLTLNDMKCLICNKIFRERELFEEHKNNCNCLSEKKLNNMKDQTAITKNGNIQLNESNFEEYPRASSSSKANFNNCLYGELGACSKTTREASSNENQLATSLQMLSCEVCSTMFSGYIPYKQHLESLKHKKKVEKLKIISKENVFKSEKFSSQNIKQNVNEEYDIKSVNCINKFEHEFPYLDIKLSNVTGNNESDVMQESDQFSIISSTSSIEILEKS